MTTVTAQYKMYGAKLKAIGQTCRDKKVAVTKAQVDALKDANSVVQGLAYQMRYYPTTVALHPSHENDVVAIINEMTDVLKPHSDYLNALVETITPLV